MGSIVLKDIEREDIQLLLKKPSFLSEKDEKELIKLLSSNSLSKFSDYVLSLTKELKEILKLYFYLQAVSEDEGKTNEWLTNYVCWRLFHRSEEGWSRIETPQIIEYCREHATDKELIPSLKKSKVITWYSEFLKLYALEKKIEKNIKNIAENTENIESNALSYVTLGRMLLKKEFITKEQFELLIHSLEMRTTLCVRVAEEDYIPPIIIGSLISEKLQKECGFKETHPKRIVK